MTDVTEFPEMIPGLDIEGGLARLAGNKMRYQDLLLKFFEERRQTDLEIEKALRLADLETVRHKAHMVRGIAGNLGVV